MISSTGDKERDRREERGKKGGRREEDVALLPPPPRLLFLHPGDSPTMEDCAETAAAATRAVKREAIIVRE